VAPAEVEAQVIPYKGQRWANIIKRITRVQGGDLRERPDREVYVEGKGAATACGARSKTPLDRIQDLEEPGT
jgi:hypothetical protein